ncbi:MAG: hypothetical protein A3F09_00840 [Chlamydiae bacterium RIFCSPHIGHO2_12_FULL_49_11]|nr:MAG: hypothetical protein A3F09_00840 [Chlamydiae bacterium RIFCSPHIGHO2_12_FULL_49_11]
MNSIIGYALWGRNLAYRGGTLGLRKAQKIVSLIKDNPLPPSDDLWRIAITSSLVRDVFKTNFRPVLQAVEGGLFTYTALRSIVLAVESSDPLPEKILRTALNLGFAYLGTALMLNRLSCLNPIM